MLFPVIKLYVFVLSCTSFADARLVRVKRSVQPQAELDINSLDLSSPEWVNKYLKNKIIQKDAITFELGLPQYEILNPEDQPEIITQDHPHYFENLKRYGQHDDLEQQDEIKPDIHKHDDYEHHDANVSSMQNNSTTSAETQTSQESIANETEDPEGQQFKFVFVKAKSTTSEKTKTEKPKKIKPTKSANHDKEANDDEQPEEQHMTDDTKQIKPDEHQNLPYPHSQPNSPEAEPYDSYHGVDDELHGAASASSYQQHAYPPYGQYQPISVYPQTTAYMNPFNNYGYNYNYGSEQPPHMREFEQLYHAALASQERYRRRLSMYPQFYSPKKYYYQ